LNKKNGGFFGSCTRSLYIFLSLGKEIKQITRSPQAREQVSQKGGFLMKKKLVFIAMLTVLLTLSFVSCKDDDVDPYTITITGIPSNANYKIGVVGLGKNNGDLVAMNNPTAIAGGQFTAELYHVNDVSITDSPFADTGTYIIILFIYKQTPLNDSTRVYDGYILSKTINSAATNISFSSFIDDTNNSINILNSLQNIIE